VAQEGERAKGGEAELEKGNRSTGFVVGRLERLSRCTKISQGGRDHEEL